MNNTETNIVSESTEYTRTLTISTDHILESFAGKPFSPKYINVERTEGKPTFKVRVSGHLIKRDGTTGRRTETSFAHPGSPGNSPVPEWILTLISIMTPEGRGAL